MGPEIDFNMNFEENQQADADKRLVAIFFVEPLKNESKSIEANRPIFDDTEMIKILFPGQRDTVVAMADEGYKQRFPLQYARFKQNQDQTSTGTPLNQLPWMTVSQIAEFKAVNCHTVEQLVGMPDSVSQKFMGHHAIKQRAQMYLTLAKDAEPMSRLENELQKRDDQIAELQRQMTEMIAAQKDKSPKTPVSA